MQINKPILINELYTILSTCDSVKGVQNIKSIEIVNKVGESLGLGFGLGLGYFIIISPKTK